MKKFLALLLAVLMIASMSVTAFATNAKDDQSPADDLAATLGGEEGTSLNNKEVTVVSKKDTTDGDPAIVYHVVVKWEALDFQFDFTLNQSEMIWDPVSHTYKAPDGDDAGTELDALTGVWVNGDADSATIQNAVTVTNHSNAEVSVSASVTGNEKNGVTTEVSANPTEKLPSAVGLATDAEALAWSWNVTVEGTPTIVTKFTVDTVTLEIGA